MVDLTQTLEARTGKAVIRIAENKGGDACGVKRNSGIHCGGCGVQQMCNPGTAETAVAEYRDTVIVMIGYAVKSSLSGITAGCKELIGILYHIFYGCHTVVFKVILKIVNALLERKAVCTIALRSKAV